MNNASDGLPHYDLRKGKISYEDFLKGYSTVLEEKTVLCPLTPSDLADLFASIEIKDLRVDSILMNAYTYSNLRKWGRDVLDIECERENLEKGLMGRIWGAHILITRNIPDGVVIATPIKEHGICATLMVGQEEFYNLNGFNELRDQAAQLQRSLNQVYTQMEKLVNKALSTLKDSKK